MDSIVLLMPVVISIIALGVVARVAYARWFRTVEQGFALIVSLGTDDPFVSFKGAWVVPGIHRVETVDLRLRALEVSRTGADALVCSDGIRADVHGTFQLRVARTPDDILKMARVLGAAASHDVEALNSMFQPKLNEALEMVASQVSFQELQRGRDELQDRLLVYIGMDLNGFVFDDCVLSRVQRSVSA